VFRFAWLFIAVRRPMRYRGHWRRGRPRHRHRWESYEPAALPVVAAGLLPEAAVQRRAGPVERHVEFLGALHEPLEAVHV
jgi:hypothetical protein